MAEAFLELNKPLTKEERDEMRRSLAPILVETRVRPRLSFLPPPCRLVEKGVGLQHSLGIDPMTILVISLASGAGAFLTRLTQEMAVDFWKEIKRLLTTASKRRKAIPLNSAQFQVSAETSHGFEIAVVTTWFNARFLNEGTVSELARTWHQQLLSTLEQADEQISQDLIAEDRTRRSIVVHAVAYGSAAPEWHIGIGDADATTGQL